ncbi:MAG: hypothetical protein PHQ22_04940 [Sulfuricurvum sp.]|nr:hypothetical protein [Sulfuricurvum sp.]MDD5386525.1 hypothetical protein [Sulfuricurvum sp.]
MSRRKKLKILGCKVSNEMLTYCIQCLKKLQLKIYEQFGTSIIDNPDKYESLLPNEKADTDNQYSKMLQVALETPKSNNIAVTGTYGSGKSSFLRTFENKNKDWEYLHISLATFQDIEEKIANAEDEKSIIGGENPSDSDSSNKTYTKATKDQKQKNEQLNQILEKSILQQIFYKEKDETIPFSRFKRISNIKKRYSISHSFFIGIVLFYSLAVLLPEKVHAFLMCDVKKQIDEYPFIGLIVFFILGFYFYKIFQYFMKLQVSKFNIKSGEIEVNNKDKTSILNEHLDEVLYFFEVTSYNVVVIEDLDRFENTEIFIKLRELNTLINNSKDINRRVVFIYAIKDDMFKDKDRTKFFDFIVPIIPYINSSSSFQKIKEKFNQDNIDIEFLRNLSLRIDDMRLLINIANEYKIYKHKIGSKTLSKERLLAMIVYKNFYPSDFAELHSNQGNVYDIFNQRTRYINEELAKNKVLQVEKNKEINHLENMIALEKQKSIDELRMIYILKIISQVNSTSFRVQDGSQYSISNIQNLLTNEIFNKIKNTQTNYGYTFHQIENEINSQITYDEREKLIIEYPNEQLEQLKKELEFLKKQESEIKKYDVSQIAKIENSQIFKKIEKENLLKFLIREGYIRDDYYNYISYFFPGSLTFKDRDFVLAVKDDKPLEFQYTLNNIEEILKNLTTKDFESKAVLNFSLLDYMLEKNLQGDKFDYFITNLTDGSDISKEFISFFIFTPHQKAFLKIVHNKWVNIWFYIYKEKSLTEAAVNAYFQIFFKCLNVEELLAVNVNNSLKAFIEDNSYLPDYDPSNDKFESLILELQIKYKRINANDFKNVPLIVDFIFKNDLYELNQGMIKNYIERFKLDIEINKRLLISNYTTINEYSSLTSDLLLYIHKEINLYVENVLLSIQENSQESEDMIVELLNNEELDLKNKKAIIKKEEVKITDISTIPNDLWLEVLRENRVLINWDNLLFYYKESCEFDKYLIDALNINLNFIELSKYKINNEEVFGKEFLQLFSRQLLKENKINNEAYSNLIKSIIWRFGDLNIDALSSEKLEMILMNKKISLNSTTLNSLKKNSSQRQITLIESFKDEFLANYKELPLDDDNYIQILISDKFTNDEKVALIETIDLSLLKNEKLVHKIIDFYMLVSNTISEDLFDVLFDNSNYDNALKILVRQIPELDEAKITSLLNRLEGQYSELTLIATKPLMMSNSEINKKLAEALEIKKYISSKTIKGDEIKVNRKRK